VYDDPVHGGGWFRCGPCGFAGDGVDLAAFAWESSVPCAVLRLASEAGCFDAASSSDERIARHVRDHVRRRAEVEALWADARGDTDHSTADLARARARFGLGDSVNGSEEWADRGGHFVGASSRALVDAVFHREYRESLAEQVDRAKGKGGLGGDRTFRGEGWDRLLAIAFHDLPGRISGFLLVGRGAHPSKDWVFRPTMAASASKQGRLARVRGVEAGLAMYEAIRPGGHPEFGDAVFGLDDVELAVRLQMDHLRRDAAPLPVCASWGRVGSAVRTLESWSPFQGRPVVLWSAKPTASTYRQARLAGARVAPPDAVTPAVKLSGRGGASALRRMQEKAVPWEAAAERHAAGLDRGDCEELLLRLRLDKAGMAAFLAGCAPDNRSRFAEILGPRSGLDCVQVGSGYILRTPAGWVRQKTGELITDAPPRVDRVVHLPGAGRSFYQGVIPWKGEEIPFVAPKADFERGPLSWAYDHLVENGHGAPRVQRRWDQHAMAILTHLHAPAYESLTGRVGWDRDARAFDFPGFSIGRDSLAPEFLPGAGVPGRNLRPPSPLTAAEVAALSRRDDATVAFWAAAATILASAIAPAVGAPSPSVVLVGDGAQHAGMLAALALGCTVVEPGVAGPASAWVAAEEARWPVAYGPRIAPRDHLVGLPRPAVACASAFDAAILAVAGWQVVRGDGPAGRVAASLCGGDRIVPCYLAHLAARKYALPDGPSLAPAVPGRPGELACLRGR